MKTTTKKVMALAIFSSTLLFSGCQKDLYDPEYAASKNGLIAGVPSDFNWSTISSVNLTVNVDDQYNGEFYYVVEVYDNNPLYSSDAKLLAKGVAKKGVSLQSLVTIPQGLKTLYICQVNPNGNREVGTIDISSATLTYNFGNAVSVKRASINTRSIATRSSSYTYPTYTSVPSGAQEITSSNNTITTGGTYVITNSYNGSIKFPDEGNATLYLKGKWTNTSSSFTLQSKMNIIILDGGEFTTNADLTITGSNDPSIIIMPTGKFNYSSSKKTDIYFNTNGTIVNEGIFNIGSLSFSSSSSFQNNGVSTIKALTFNSPLNFVVNDNKLTVAEMNLVNGSFTNNYETNIGDITTNGTAVNNSGVFNADNLTLNGGIFTNNCKVVVKNIFKTTDKTPTLNLGSNTSFQANILNGKDLTANMNSYSILYISDNATITNGAIFSGTGDNYALLKMEKVSIDRWHQVTYDGKLKVEADKHSSNSKYNWGTQEDYYHLTNGATLSVFKEAEFKIPSTSCSEGNTPGGNTPSNPAFPIDVNLGTTYTYAMEDLWPNYGDYDMNDIVLAIKPKYTLSSASYVKSMTMDVTLKAIGATKSLAAAIQLDNIAKDNVTGVTYTAKSTNGSVFEVGSNMVEVGQTKAVIPLFDNAHGFLGNSGITNTIKGGASASNKTVTITITFKENTVVPANISEIQSLNFFIVTDQKKTSRTEVHLRGFKATDHVNKSLFGTGVDNSSTKSYSSIDNLVWGMIIPTDFSYPTETTNIQTAYPNFKNWAISDGQNNQDWYITPASGLTY